MQYTRNDVFKFNYLFWCVGFMVGLNFTHFDEGPMKHLTLDPQIMKTWGLGLWALFAAIMALLFGILFRIYIDYSAIGIVKYYAIWAGILATAISFKNKQKVAEGYVIHFHHYCVALVMITFMSYQSVFLSLIQSFFCGMLIEGGARWGFDEIWVPRESLVASAVNIDTKRHTKAERKTWILASAAQSNARMENLAKPQMADGVASPVSESVPFTYEYDPSLQYLKPADSETKTVLPAELLALLTPN